MARPSKDIPAIKWVTFVVDFFYFLKIKLNFKDPKEWEGREWGAFLAYCNEERKTF